MTHEEINRPENVAARQQRIIEEFKGEKSNPGYGFVIASCTVMLAFGYFVYKLPDIISVVVGLIRDIIG